MCLIIGGIVVGAYYAGVTFGATTDLVGIAQAEGALGGMGASTDVAAGLAVQGEFSGVGDHIAAYFAHGDPNSSESGYGLAQTNSDEISGLGLGNGDPEDSSVAVKVMQTRIGNAQRACAGCTPKDRVIAAALAQNRGIDLSTLGSWAKQAKGGGIDWNQYFSNEFKNAKNSPDAQFRENVTHIRYPTYFMVDKYVTDLFELERRGWVLPYGITNEELSDLETWAKNNGQNDFSSQ